jgi:hypothetical protein
VLGDEAERPRHAVLLGKQPRRVASSEIRTGAPDDARASRPHASRPPPSDLWHRISHLGHLSHLSRHLGHLGLSDLWHRISGSISQASLASLSASRGISGYQTSGTASRGISGYQTSGTASRAHLGAIRPLAPHLGHLGRISGYQTSGTASRASRSDLFMCPGLCSPTTSTDRWLR